MSEISDGRYALRKRTRSSTLGPVRSGQGEEDESDRGERAGHRGRRRRRQFCPVCENFISGSESVILKHIDTCLISPSSSSEMNDSEEGSNFDEYEWAGQRRVRATSFLEGGDSGFTSITHGNEDEVLDIENELLHKLGPPQYTAADIIFPEAETAKEQSERDSLLVLLGHKKVFTPSQHPEREEEGASPSPSAQETTAAVELSELESLQKQVQFLKLQNDELRNKTLCKICMDNYEKPLISLECWHAHCEQCWLRTLGVKKLCPQCKVITNPEDLRKIFL